MLARLCGGLALNQRAFAQQRDSTSAPESSRVQSTT